MNRHDLANLEQLALLRESLKAEPTQQEKISEPTQPVSEPAAPDNADANPEPLS